MSNVKPREGGPYSLYCYDCGEWVPNTANAEMGKEGCYAHSHWCKPIAPCEPAVGLTYAELHRVRTEAKADGAQAERERIRAAVRREIQYMVEQGYSIVEYEALRRVLPLIAPKEAE